MLPNCHDQKIKHQKQARKSFFFFFSNLLMSKLNFLGLCVVIQQHTPLDVVEVYLKNKNTLIFLSRRVKPINFHSTQDLKFRKRLLLTNLQRSPQKTILSSCQRGFKSRVNQSITGWNKGTHLVHINGRKHVLKHGGHEFDLHAIRAKVVKDEKGVMCELLVVHPVFLQRWHHIFDEGILRKIQSLGYWEGPVADSEWQSLGTSVHLLWKHYHQSNVNILSEPTIFVSLNHAPTFSTLKWSIGPLGSRATL